MTAVCITCENHGPDAELTATPDPSPHCSHIRCQATSPRQCHAPLHHTNDGRTIISQVYRPTRQFFRGEPLKRSLGCFSAVSDAERKPCGLFLTVASTTTQSLQASESSWGVVSAVPPSASMASMAGKRGAALGIHGIIFDLHLHLRCLDLVSSKMLWIRKSTDSRKGSHGVCVPAKLTRGREAVTVPTWYERLGAKTA